MGVFRFVIEDIKKNVGKYRNSVDRFGLGLIRLVEMKKRLVIFLLDGYLYSVKVYILSWWL